MIQAVPGMLYCRVTVNMTGAPLGSRVWVDATQPWTKPLLEKGMLVPIDPLSGDDRALEETEPVSEDDAPPQETESLLEPLTAPEETEPVVLPVTPQLPVLGTSD